MSRFSIISFPFFYAEISRNEEIFSKNSGKFSAAAADWEKKIEISQPPPPIAKSFLAAAAAAGKDIGLHLYLQSVVVFTNQELLHEYIKFTISWGVYKALMHL